LRISNCIAFFFFVALSLFSAYAQDTAKFRISDVHYDIKGHTREFPLSQKVDIDRERIFDSEASLRAYVSDLEVKFRNLRVLESANIDVAIDAASVDGITPVTLTVHTVDSWNLIALPRPNFDSNNGYQLKLKLKNYNFLGSMEEMNLDGSFNIDNNGDKDVGANFDFTIPFALKGHAVSWTISSELTIPFDEVPEYVFSTGFDLKQPLGFADLHVGVVQGLSLNARNSDDELEDDRFYLTEKAYVNLPYTIHEFDYVGKFLWTPELSINQNWNAEGIKDPDLTGPDFTVSHAFSIGRVDWIGNFRKGFSATVSNAYVYDFYKKNGWDVSVTGTVEGFTTFFDRIGINTRVIGFTILRGDPKEKAGDVLRGILDKRITTDRMISMNFDLPVRIMRVNFEEITGVHWTRYISFDMQASPFFDMALTHDEKTGRYFSLDDGWYAGGMELIVYPLKMRSIYARASIGFDLSEVAKSGKLTGNASRDGETVHEYLIGIGLHY
jgi:hypothetical protein